MQERATFASHKALFLSTLAFTVCFAAWMINGVLVTYLTSNQVFEWGSVQSGWLMGIPVLTGALLRLPAGMVTDRLGGKPVMGVLLLFCAIPMYLLSLMNGFAGFALCSYGFGLTGASFSVGVAYTSIWYPKKNQGFALGVFGAGSAGAAMTTLFAPRLLDLLTRGGAEPERWRILPRWYAAALVLTGVVFLLFATNKKPQSSGKTVGQMLAPLRNRRVWRFGLYYFLVFGCFVAFSQWLVPYFLSAYYMPLATAGFLAACFSLPSGILRILGGWLSDRRGARTVMYCVLTASILISGMLLIPKMEIYSPGQSVMATRSGTVTAVGPTAVTVGDKTYPLIAKKADDENFDEKLLVFPAKEVWQEPAVKEGQTVQRKELLAKGVTKIYFQANMWIFALLVIALGAVWGIGMGAVYKHIPDYFPEEIGVVGGIVGVIGGLGGFFCPILFGYLLSGTGLWTSCWGVTLLLSAVCLIWMHQVVQRIVREKCPGASQTLEG